MLQSPSQDGALVSLRLFPESGIALAVVGLGAAAVSLDTAVNLAFPYISKIFDLNVGIAWVVASYLLPLASLILIFGKLGDLFGLHRLIFQIGLALSAIAFVFYYLAPRLLSQPSDFLWLLAARALQGVGAAMTLSCSLALVTSLYHERRRTSVIAVYSTWLSLGTAAGPLAGAVLIEHLNWTAVFWFRAPIVTLIFILSFIIPKTRKKVLQIQRLDWLGASLLFIWVSAIVAILTKGQLEQSIAIPSSAVMVACVAIATSGFIAFLYHESTFVEPIIKPRHFRHSEFVFLVIIVIILYVVSFAPLLLVPYYPERSAVFVGRVLTIALAGIPLGSFLAKWITRYLRIQVVGLCGAALVAASTAFVAIADIQFLTPLLLLQSVGVGIFQVAFIDILAVTLPMDDRGVAGSLAQLLRMIGYVFGAAVLAGIPQMLGAAGFSSSTGFVFRLQVTFAAAAAGLGPALLLSMVRWRQLWFPQTSL